MSVPYITESETPDGMVYIDHRSPKPNTLVIKTLRFEPLVYHGYDQSLEVIAREILHTLHSFQLSGSDLTLDVHQ